MKTFILTSFFASLVLLSSAGAGAATIEGQRFEDSTRVANQELKLNGLGLRAVFIIKAYAAGLYLNEKASTLQDAMALPGPKRLQLRMLRAAGPSDFNNALVAGIRKNATEADLGRLSERIAQLERTIEAIGATVSGDTINLDYVPDKGTLLVVNGNVKGDAIRGADFYHAVLGIFVGDNPVDAKLKRGLLGQ